MKKNDYQSHVVILAWINIGFSALVAFIGVFGFFFLLGLGAVSDDPSAAPILGFVGLAGAGFLFILALPGFRPGTGCSASGAGDASWGSSSPSSIFSRYRSAPPSAPTACGY